MFSSEQWDQQMLATIVFRLLGRTGIISQLSYTIEPNTISHTNTQINLKTFLNALIYHKLTHIHKDCLCSRYIVDAYVGF